jgi:precorrin-2 dehydrogenase / sirohydrochlorin ferrochelatase
MRANLFPMFVKLSGHTCLVVGAGEVATSKITSLLEAGARVTVVAPQATSSIRELAASGKVEWFEREFQADDLLGVFLAVAATSRPEVNRAVFLEAQMRGVLCNAVDDPPNCNFYFPAVVRRGDLQIAISTSGESPAFAQRIRRVLDENLGESVGDWLCLVGSLRRKILATHPPSEERKKNLHLLASSELCESENCAAHDPALELAGRHLHLPEEEI